MVKKRKEAQQETNELDNVAYLKDMPSELEGHDIIDEVDAKNVEPAVRVKRGPTTMWRLTSARNRGKKFKVRYDSLGRALYNDNKSLQSYIGHVARSMVPININNWRAVEKDIKMKIWEEICNVFEVAPQTQKTVLSSAAQKWRDWKTKMTKKYVWPFRDSPEEVRSTPPPEYQISEEVWKEFVDIRLSAAWKVTHDLQKGRTSKLKYRHKVSRKGYVGLEAELREKNVIAEDEEVDRSMLWVKARSDSEGKITDPEVEEVKKAIDVWNEKKAKGEFKPEGTVDVLTKALGTDEKYGRVRGIGGFVKPQTFFGTARKTRATASKALAESLKEKTKEADSLKEELARVRVELAAEKASKSTPVSSKKSSNAVGNEFDADGLEVERGKLDGEAGKEADIEAVENLVALKVKNSKGSVRQPPNQTDSPKTKESKPKERADESILEIEDDDDEAMSLLGKKCKLAIDQEDNIVAYGTIVSEGGPGVLLHSIPLGEGNFKVAIDGLCDDEVDPDLPIPIKNGPCTVGEAIGSFVAWPKELVIVDGVEVKSKAGGSDPAERCKDPETDRSLPRACKFMYNHADRLMKKPVGGSIKIQFDEELFGHEGYTWLTRDGVFDFMEMKPIGAPHIQTYMFHLFAKLKEKDRGLAITFVNPSCVPGDGNPTTNEKYLVDRLTKSSRGSIVLIPHNTGRHWILTVINEEKDKVFLLDSMGNRNRYEKWKSTVVSAVKKYRASVLGKPKPPVFKQLTGNLKQNPNALECGYCVMRYMKEITDRDDPDMDKMFAGTVKDQYYSQAQYDEIRIEWSDFVFDLIT